MWDKAISIDQKIPDTHIFRRSKMPQKMDFWVKKSSDHTGDLGNQTPYLIGNKKSPKN